MKDSASTYQTLPSRPAGHLAFAAEPRDVVANIAVCACNITGGEKPDAVEQYFVRVWRGDCDARWKHEMKYSAPERTAGCVVLKTQEKSGGDLLSPPRHLS